MTHTLAPRFPRISTIDEVYRPVERFRERLDPAIAGPSPLTPLDAYLLHLVVEFCPRPTFVADLACDSTSGATSVVCLANAGATRVAPATSGLRGRPGGASLGDLLVEFAAESEPARGKVVLPIGRAEAAWDAIRVTLSPHEPPLFLIDATDPDRTGDRPVGAILDEFPRALVLVLNVGKAGDCEAAQRLVAECHNRSPHRLWLVHEVASPLLASRLALVARRDHPFAAPLVRRIEQVFTTGYDFLNLVRDSCMYAVEKGIAQDLDRDIHRLNQDIHHLNQDIHHRNQEIHRLNQDIHHRDQDIQRRDQDLQRRDQECRDLQHRLDREWTRPIVRTLILQSGRRLLYLGRKNRAFLAPEASRRERVLKALMRAKRRLRGDVA